MQKLEKVAEELIEEIEPVGLLFKSNFVLFKQQKLKIMYNEDKLIKHLNQKD